MRSKKTLKERFILLQRKMAVALRFFLVCSVFFCPHFDVFADTDQITRQKISTPDTTKIYFYNPLILLTSLKILFLKFSLFRNSFYSFLF